MKDYLDIYLKPNKTIAVLLIFLIFYSNLNQIAETSYSNASERTYTCIAKWNYVARPNIITYIIKELIKELISSGLSLISLIYEIADLAEDNAALYNVTFIFQLDASNTIALIIKAPPSKIMAIDRYLILKTIDEVLTVFLALTVGVCIIEPQICEVISLIFGIFKLILGALTLYYQKVAHDPYDKNYTVIIQIPLPPENITKLADIYGNIVHDMYYSSEYIKASITSLGKAYAAYEEEDIEWYTKQLLYAKEFSKNASIVLEKMKISLNETLTQLELHLTKDAFYTGLDYMKQYGLPNKTREVLSKLGVLEFINTAEAIKTAKTIGYIEVKPREIVEEYIDLTRDIQEHITLLERELKTNTSTTLKLRELEMKMKSTSSPIPMLSSCSIEGINIVDTGTTVINGVIYPVVVFTLRVSGSCGDTIRVVDTIPSLDPAGEKPVLECNHAISTQTTQTTLTTFPQKPQYRTTSAPYEGGDFGVIALLIFVLVIFGALAILASER
jgi:hypothetical protein